jgi:ribonuclease Z
MDAPRIVLFSTPLISTWVFDETHRILFDAGDGISAMLDSLIHKIRLAAITHTHRDHCAGLMQLLNLRGGAGDFVVIHPEGSGSARTLATFLSSFDSRSTAKVTWIPLAENERYDIQPARHFIRSFATHHYPAQDPPRFMSAGYHIVRYVDKVREEFRHLPQEELDRIRKERGKEALCETLEDILFSISGDTSPLDPGVFYKSRAMLHECTFMSVSEREEMDNYGHPHSCMEEVLDIARCAKVERLGLYHISRRYEDEYILCKVRETCQAMKIPFPVSVALPGRVVTDLFSEEVWHGLP